jgi:hypothetical protein
VNDESIEKLAAYFTGIAVKIARRGLSMPAKELMSPRERAEAFFAAREALNVFGDCTPEEAARCIRRALEEAMV